MQQLRATTKSLTCPPLSIARYSFIQLSQQGRQWRERKCPIFDTVAKQDSNAGSLGCESGILPLSYRAPRDWFIDNSIIINSGETFPVHNVINDHRHAINSWASLSRHKFRTRFVLSHHHDMRSRISSTMTMKCRMFGCRAHKSYVHMLRQLSWTFVLIAADGRRILCAWFLVASNRRG